MAVYAVAMVRRGGRRHPNSLALSWTVGCAIMSFVGAGVLGFAHTLPQVNLYTHGTLVTAMHGHLAFWGAYAMLVLGMISYALPLLTGRKLYNTGVSAFAFWTSNIGMVSMTAAFAVAGVTQVYLERRVGMDFPRRAGGIGGALLGRRAGRGPVQRRHPGLRLHLREVRLAGGRGQRVGDSRVRLSGAMSVPYYRPIQREVEVFEHAYRNQLALMIKGPTGCGKTRFVEAMAAKVERPLVTVACHDDTTATDLLGRYLVEGGDTVWQDGPAHPRRAPGGDPLPRRVRRGAQKTWWW